MTREGNDRPSDASATTEGVVKASLVRWGLDPSRLDDPQPRPWHVPRAAIVERVCDPAARLVSVVAPAGYGKTRVIAQALQATRTPFAWIGAGPDCSDVTTFARYLAAALEPTSTLADELIRELDATHARPSVLAAGLGDAFRRGAGDLLLVLDDVQVLDTAGRELVRTLVHNTPADARVVVIGTHALPLLSAERLDGGVCEVGVDDLVFDEADVEALLRRMGVTDVEHLDVGGLIDRTEGWPAGLYLAGLAIREGSSPRHPDPLELGVRFVTQYLSEAVLARLPDDDVDFLIRTSVLDELSGPICDEVLQTRQAAERLARFDDENLFVVPLDDHGDRYRYHGLFQEALALELDRRDPGAATHLHLRAAEWYDARGRPEDAFRHAAAAGDIDRCARLLVRDTQRLYVSGRGALVADWLAWFGEHAPIDAHPAVATRALWFMIMTGRHAGIERWAAAAASGPLEPADEGVRLLAEAAMARHGLDAMARATEAGRSLLPPESTWWPAAWILTGICALLRGDIGTAIPSFHQAVEHADGLSSHAGHAIALSELGICLLHRGEGTEAAEIAREVRRVIAAGGLDGYPSTALSLAVVARVALQRGDPERAASALGEADALRRDLNVVFPIPAIQARLEMARCAIGLGDVRGARTYLDEAADLVRERPHVGTLVDDLAAVEEALSDRLESGPAVRTLTPAERRLLPLLATHLSFRDIGEQLFISHHTVKTEAISIYRKLGVTSRSAAVDEARRLGLLGR